MKTLYRTVPALCTGILCLMSATAASGQPAETPAETPTTPAVPAPTEEQKPISFGDVSKDIITPDAPGFVALGVAQNDVVHPESLKKIAVGVLNGLDQNGNFQSGVALQFSPALLLFGDRITYDKYVNSRATQLLTRFELMAAVAKGTGDDKSARAAFGFTWTPIDTADPYANKALGACIDNAFRALETDPATDPLNPNLDPAKRAQVLRGYDTTVKKCHETEGVPRSKAIVLQMGFSPLFVSPSGETDAFRSKGFAANAVFSIGIDNILRPSPVADDGTRKRAGQLILGAAYRKEETVAHPTLTDQFVDRDRFNVGGRLLVGSLSKALFGAELLYQRANYEGGLGRDNYITYTATADIKIAEGFWLGLAAGGASGNRVFGNEGFIGTRFRWGIGPKASLGDRFKD